MEIKLCISSYIDSRTDTKINVGFIYIYFYIFENDIPLQSHIQVILFLIVESLIKPQLILQ